MLELTIKDLNKSFLGRKVLDGINLQLKSGEVHAIVGKNGSGKTTFFRCVANLIGYSGTIEVLGNTLKKHHVFFLPTEPVYLRFLTGREYLLLLAKARRLVDFDVDKINVFDLPLEEYAVDYSTGMKKKLALSGMLISSYEVYVLDEPMNGLDLQSSYWVLELIKKIHKANKVVLISSHIFGVLQDSASKLHLFDDGKIVESVEKIDFERIKSSLSRRFVNSKIDDLKID